MGLVKRQIIGKRCRVCNTINHENALECGKCGSNLRYSDVVYKK